MKGVMTMAIKPISSVDYASRTLVSFWEKHRKGRKSGGGGRQTSATAAIPVVVLMAMSPLNQSVAAENYNKRITSSPTTEVVVQNPQKIKLPDIRLKTDDGQHFRVWGVSRDDNPNNAETVLFKYKRELGNNKVAVLAGQFLAISDTPREDGRYLMMYSPLDESGHVNGNYEITYVSDKFSGALKYFGAHPNYNNNACGVRPMTSFVRKFGEDAVKNAPNIEDATNLILNKAN